MSDDDNFEVANTKVHQGIIESVGELVSDRHITKDKLAREVRAVAQMAAFDGHYNHATNAYRLTAELKGFITKSGEAPAPMGGVHQHQHVHLEQSAIESASDDDLKAQLNKIALLESNIKDAEIVDDVDLS